MEELKEKIKEAQKRKEQTEIDKINAALEETKRLAREEKEKEERLLKELPEKMTYTDNIWKWINDFYHSEEYKSIIGLRSFENGIILFPYIGGDYGEKITESGHHGSYSKLLLKKNGSITYNATPKWGFYRDIFSCSSSAEIAEKFSIDYIKKLAEHIKSNAILTTIADQL